MTEAAAQTKPSDKPQSPATDAVAKKKRHRSPSYPAINLEVALQRAREVFQHERKNSAPLEVVMQHWGFSSKSSGGLLAAAAMKKFGLLDEVPGMKDRHVRLSQRALNIILDEQEESSERNALIKEAALLPELHLELWNKYKDGGLPSDASLRTYLIRDKDFTEQAAKQFIEEYKQTISFAGVNGEDIIQNLHTEDDSGGSMEDVISQEQTLQPPSPALRPTPPVGQTKPLAKPQAPAGQKDFPLYLSENKRGVLYIPPLMTKKDYDLLKAQIENHLMVIEATSVQDGGNN